MMVIYKSALWILTKRMEYNFRTCSEAWKDISLLLREEKINTLIREQLELKDIMKTRNK